MKGAALTATVMFLTQACSLGIKQLPANWKPEQPPECDSSIKRPLGDAGLAIAAGVGGIAAGAQWGRSWCDGEACKVAAVTTGLALFLVAMPIEIIIGRRGMLRVRECRKAKQRHRDWLQHQREGRSSTSRPR